MSSICSELNELREALKTRFTEYIDPTTNIAIHFSILECCFRSHVVSPAHVPDAKKAVRYLLRKVDRLNRQTFWEELGFPGGMQWEVIPEASAFERQKMIEGQLVEMQKEDADQNKILKAMDTLQLVIQSMEILFSCGVLERGSEAYTAELRYTCCAQIAALAINMTMVWDPLRREIGRLGKVQ